MQLSTQSEYRSPGILPSGRFSRYDAPSCPEGTWRIGTIGDGSCFFHAVLTSVSADYRGFGKTDRSEKKRMVEDVRNQISSTLSQEKWDLLQDGCPSQVGLQSCMRTIESRVYKILSNPEKYERSSTRRWVFNSLNNDKICMECLRNVLGRNLFSLADFVKMSEDHHRDIATLSSKVSALTVRRFAVALESNPEFITTHGLETIEKTALLIGQLVTACLLNARETSLRTVKSRIKDPEMWIGMTFVPLFEEHFKTEIRIIDGGTGHVYTRDFRKEESSSQYSNITVLLAVSDSHYECLGTEKTKNEMPPRIVCSFPIGSVMDTSTSKEPPSPTPYENRSGDESDVSESYAHDSPVASPDLFR